MKQITASELEKYDIKVKANPIGPDGFVESSYPKGSFKVVKRGNDWCISRSPSEPSLVLTGKQIQICEDQIQICEDVELYGSETRDWYCYACETSKSHTKRTLHDGDNNKVINVWVCSVCSRTLNEYGDDYCQLLLNSKRDESDDRRVMSEIEILKKEFVQFKKQTTKALDALQHSLRMVGYVDGSSRHKAQAIIDKMKESLAAGGE